MMQSPIIPVANGLNNKLMHGENDFAEMGAWGDSARQLRQFADMLTDLAADCVNERREGEKHAHEHAYARIREGANRTLQRELIAMVGRLTELENDAIKEMDAAQEEHEALKELDRVEEEYEAWVEERAASPAPRNMGWRRKIASEVPL